MRQTELSDPVVAEQQEERLVWQAAMGGMVISAVS